MDSTRRKNEHEILRCLIGSRAYGTSLPDSDEDFKGIYIPPKRAVIGITGSEIPNVQKGEQTRRFTKDDHSFSLRHFAKKAADCVPNVLELLFGRQEDILYITEEGQKLRNARRLFVSQRCIPKYIGYAESQMLKAAKKPENRGQGRLDLIEKFGYDTKHAMHTIRLLESAKDLLTHGNLNVWRPNAEFLLQIRHGEAYKCYEDFRKHGLTLIKELRELTNTTELPKNPDMAAIDTLVIALHESYWTKNPEME